MSNELDADLADLFGASSDEEEQQTQHLEKTQQEQGPEGQLDTEAEAMNDIFGQDSDQGDELEQPKTSLSVSLPNDYDQIDQTDKLYLMKLPSFLHVEPTPFDPLTWQPNDQTHIQNTLRWKYDLNNGLKKSNARIIKWSDGSRTLLIGSEQFEISQKNIVDHQYLVAHHQSDAVLQTQARFNNVWSFKPIGMNSATHLRIAKSLKFQKQVKTVSYTPATNPELDLKEVEKAEMEKMRYKRRLEAKQRTSRRGLTEDALEDSDDDIGVGRRYERYTQEAQGDEYDDNEDDLGGFVVNSDDEEEEGERRIRKAKRRDSDDENGLNKKRRVQEGESEGEESEEEESEDDEEEIVRVKKGSKKRIIESSEEDD